MSGRRHAAIAGVGSALPDRVVPNAYFESVLDTSDEWIRQRTGIGERRFAADGQTTSDLGTAALRSALDAAGIAPDQLDLIICATLTPDTPIPAAAVWTQRKLGIGCPAFDVNAACAGFSFGLSTGAAFIESGAAETVAVIGAEVLSRVLDLTDRSTCVLFGDGAGAVVVEASDDPAIGILDFENYVDGSGGESLCMPAGGSLRPASKDTVDQRLHYVKQDGQAVFKFAVRNTEEACRRILQRNNLSADNIDLLVSHQANRRIILSAAEKLGVPEEKVVINIERFGNTTAATIPLALSDAVDDKRLKRGDLLLMVSVGAGFTVGSLLLKWGLKE